MVGEEEKGTSKRRNGYGAPGSKGDLCGVELWKPCWAELGAVAKVR